MRPRGRAALVGEVLDPAGAPRRLPAFQSPRHRFSPLSRGPAHAAPSPRARSLPRSRSQPPTTPRAPSPWARHRRSAATSSRPCRSTDRLAPTAEKTSGGWARGRRRAATDRPPGPRTTRRSRIDGTRVAFDRHRRTDRGVMPIDGGLPTDDVRRRPQAVVGWTPRGSADHDAQSTRPCPTCNRRDPSTGARACTGRRAKARTTAHSCSRGSEAQPVRSLPRRPRAAVVALDRRRRKARARCSRRLRDEPQSDGGTAACIHR